MSGIALAATVAILVVIIAVTAYTAVRRYDNYIEGLWAGDPGYMGTALLNDFQLYIGPREHGKRQGYIIIVDNSGAFVANQAIEIIEPPLQSRWLPALRNAFKAQKDAFTMTNVQFVFTGEEWEWPMPGVLKMTVSIMDGTLTLNDGDKIYAFLEKDIAASAAAAEISAGKTVAN